MKQKINPKRTVITGHDDKVNCLIQLKDSRLVSSSNDHMIKFWNIATLYCVGTIKDHGDIIKSMVQLYDERLLTSSLDCYIKLYDIASFKCLQQVRLKVTINSLIQLFEGEIAFGTMLNSIEIWSISTYPLKKKKTLTGTENGLYLLIQLIDTRMASGSLDNTIHIWNLRNDKPIAALRGHTHLITGLVELENSLLASASIDSTIKVWYLSTYQCVTTINITDPVLSLILLSNGIMCASSRMGIIKIVNKRTYANQRKDVNWVTKVLQLEDGRIFYCTSTSSHIEYIEN